MYRIISGKWRGKKIAAPKNFDVRPTTDFSKEALFSILDHRFTFSEISVLDLFSGIGSICLEFASRGCTNISCVEFNPKHASFIQDTAKELALDNSLNIYRSDVFEWLKKANKNGQKYDLIFADPPFNLPEKDYNTLISEILDGEILSSNGTFILEHQSRNKITDERILETRKYGNVSFSFFQNTPKEQ